MTVVVLISILILLAALCAIIGYQWALDRLDVQRHHLASQREALDAEWQALEQTRRLRELFLTARRAMQAEAQRSMREHRQQP